MLLSAFFPFNFVHACVSAWGRIGCSVLVGVEFDFWVQGVGKFGRGLVEGCEGEGGFFVFLL